jgi:hypothetical protein
MAIGMLLLVVVTLMWYLAFRQKAIYDQMKSEEKSDSTVVTLTIDTLQNPQH